ncbi:MAG: DUF1326 domain-containing protein [Vicinamibacterales bacterium]
MAWQLTGDLIEACSCNVFCPCWYGAPEVALPDKGYCTGILTFRVRDGNADGVNLAGRTILVAADFPNPKFFDGNGTGRLYVDDGASSDQRSELEAIFRGQKGGPMAVVASLITKWLPTQSRDIRVREEGDNITVSVGDVGEIQSRLLKDQEGHSFELRGGGFVSGLGMDVAQISQTSTRWSDADLPRVESKSGGRGKFKWGA